MFISNTISLKIKIIKRKSKRNLPAFIKNSCLFLLEFLLITQLISLISLSSFPKPVLASPVIDQAAGSWQDSFSDANGISSSSNTAVNGGNVELTSPSWTQTSQDDFESGTLTDIDTVSSPGNVKLAQVQTRWTGNGVAISIPAGSQDLLQLTTDGSGGAIITWEDYRSGSWDIYAQRIDSSGDVQWAENGVAISTAAGDQQYPQITTDGSGGAIITWEDSRGGSWDIYVQRIDSSGNVQWTANGVAISIATNHQGVPQLTTDGSGGAIIAWQDYRNSSNWDIYAQRIDSSGNVQWAENGVAISTAASHQQSPQLTSDGSGGAIIAWWDYRSGSWDIYAQRIDSSGNVQWTGNGVPISTAAETQELSQLTSDGSGGAIITWEDLRSEIDYDIYAQRIDSSGNVQWTGNGVPISTTVGSQNYTQLISDGSGGAIITWADSRNGNWDIYAQRIDSSGNVQWAENGVAISTAAGDQEYPQITSDGSGGAIIAWMDSRNDSGDIYAQKVVDLLSYPASGNLTSLIYDAGESVNWKNISWSETLPANTDITFQTRTSTSIWLDDFNDGDTSNVDDGSYLSDLWEWGGIFQNITEEDGILTFSNAINSPYDEDANDVYPQIDTGQDPEYFPAGSIVRARVKAVTDSEDFYIEMFTDEWADGNAETLLTNQWVNIQYTETDTFNKIGFEVYGFTDLVNDEFQIDWVRIEKPTDWSGWSVAVSDSSGSQITSPAGRYIQYKANLSTTDDAVTPVLSDVTVTAQYSSGNIVSTDIQPNQLRNWNKLNWTDNEPANADIKYQVYYYDNNTLTWVLIPDEDLNGNLVGFDDSPVDLSILSVSEYPKLRLKANLSSSDASADPAVSSWTVTWTITNTLPPGTAPAGLTFPPYFPSPSPSDSNYPSASAPPSISGSVPAASPTLSPTPSPNPFIDGIPSDFTFKNNLYLGISDSDVVYLKIILDKEVIHEKWSGNNYFGSKTFSALKRFQEKYKTEISAFAGYQIKGTGFLGAGTKAKINQLIGFK